MKKLLFTLAFALVVVAASAQNPRTIRLYPDGPAESNGLEGKELLENNRLNDVSDPRVEVYLPKKSNGQAVVVCPGGGYARLAVDTEGSYVAKWLNDRGIVALVLLYRMPNGHSEVPRTDVLATIELARLNAAKWGINPSQVGVIGFSAGGHLAATAVTKFTSPQNRPDFGILIYPVITMDAQYTHKGSRNLLIGKTPSAKTIDDWSLEKCVTPQTPPTFIALCDDDKTVAPQNSTFFYNACRAANVPAELHIFPAGGHGWGFNPKRIPEYRSEFYASLGRWLEERRAAN